MSNRSPKAGFKLSQLTSSGKRSFVYVALFSCFINLLLLVPPLYMLQVYDRVMISRSEETLLMLTLILVWMFVTMAVLDLARSRIMSRFSSRLDYSLYQPVYNQIMSKALASQDKASAQPLDDLFTLRKFIASPAPLVFFDLPWLPVFLLVLFVFDPLFGWFATAAALVLAVMAVINDMTTRKSFAFAQSEQGEAAQLVSSQLRNAEVLHAMGMHSAQSGRWQQAYQQAATHYAMATERSSLWTITSKSLRLLFQSLMLGLGAWLAINNYITAGMVIAGSIIMGRALAPIDQAISSWRSWNAFRLAYKRLDQFLADYRVDDERLSLPQPSGTISVEQAILQIPESDYFALKGISFSLVEGETLAIIGSSGAGKSCLSRAILGLWPLTSGSVRFDNADVSQWNQEELGQYIGYLPQDIELFPGTVAENIARFSDTDHQLVVQAAQLAGADKMIRRLPQGYDTEVGSAGMALSGGQRQRIALARAVFGRPKVVVLDEPNASLDQQGDQALNRACQQMKRLGMTLIIISHKREILNQADKILLLEAGKQQLFGPADAVMARMNAAQRAPVTAVKSSKAVTGDNHASTHAREKKSAV